MTLNELAKDIHRNAVKHGWWEDDRSFGEVIALCHSELSEALEEYRNEKKKTYYHCTHSSYGIADGDICPHNGIASSCTAATENACKMCAYAKPEGIATELADCIIRILDYCAHEGINIGEVIKNKHEYNKGRPYRHGGKKI